MRAAGIGPPQERIELDRKAIAFARRRADLDPDDGAAQITTADLVGALARDSESVDPAEAARCYHDAIEGLARRPDLVAANIAPKVDLYVVGQNAIRFFLRRQDPASAVEYARKVSAVMSPALFLKLNLPRSGDVINLDGLWWVASEASARKDGTAGKVRAEAVRDAEAGLAAAPKDPMMQAAAAFVFEEQGTEPYGERARTLWRGLAAAYPQNDFIRRKLAGAPFEHDAK
jgi:hypothetical protein